MRVLVATAYIPFRAGDAAVVDGLAAALAAAGHLVDTVLIPVRSHRPADPGPATAARLMDVAESSGNRIDRLVTLRYPSYALAHPSKVAWLEQLPDEAAPGASTYLREARRLYVTSRRAAEGLRGLGDSPGPVEVLRPPLPRGHPFRSGPFGDHFACNGRPELAIEALGHARPGPRLVVLGVSDDAPALRELVRRFGLEGRVELLGGVPERRRADLLAGCRAALCLGDDEDHVRATLEALHAGKPAVTCRDSGDGRELVEDRSNGLVVEPDPRALAAAMDHLWADRPAAEALGRRAQLTPTELGITWAYVARQLAA